MSTLTHIVQTVAQQAGETAPTPDELKALVKAAVQKNPKTVVMIAADKQTAHGRVVWVIDTVKGLGVASFAIQIDPASLQPPPVK